MSVVAEIEGVRQKRRQSDTKRCVGSGLCRLTLPLGAANDCIFIHTITGLSYMSCRI